jgi:hypothetical protein
MASSLTLKTGNLTSTVSSENDANVQLVLLRFAHAKGADPAWGNQRKLDFVAAQLAAYMQGIAQERYIQEESADIQAAAQTQVHW